MTDHIHLVRKCRRCDNAGRPTAILQCGCVVEDKVVHWHPDCLRCEKEKVFTEKAMIEKAAAIIRAYDMDDKNDREVFYRGFVVDGHEVTVTMCSAQFRENVVLIERMIDQERYSDAWTALNKIGPSPEPVLVRLRHILYVLDPEGLQTEPPPPERGL